MKSESRSLTSDDFLLVGVTNSLMLRSAIILLTFLSLTSISFGATLVGLLCGCLDIGAIIKLAKTA